MKSRNAAMRFRADPRSNFEILLSNANKFAGALLGIFAVIFILYFGQWLLAPIFLAIVVGLMFGPVADRIERFGVPPALSAFSVLLLFIILISIAILAVAVPLSEWLDKLPLVWSRLQNEITKWQGMFAAFESMQEALSPASGGEDTVKVTVEEGSSVQTAAFIAPSILAQILSFLISMYFFIATRHEIRLSVLRLCFSRRIRWRMAHVFNDVESRVSKYLLSITAINICLGIAVGLGMWAFGVPSPFLWGLLACLLNYVPYIGSVVMAAILFVAGLSTSSNMSTALLPLCIYLVLNFIEFQLITPHIMGRIININPFFVFLTLAFWLWLWGPMGGFIAVPSLLMALTLLEHMMPHTGETRLPARNARQSA